MIYEIELCCSSKNYSFYTTNAPMLFPESMIQIRNDMQYPTEEGLCGVIRNYLNIRDEIISAARKENWRMRFTPKNKLSTFMLVKFFSEDKNGKVLVYFYDYKTGLRYELYTINTDWFFYPNENAKDYPCLKDIMRRCGVNIN
jgi:hypothetical protein